MEKVLRWKTSAVFKFLTFLFKEGLEYSATNAARGAFSAVVQTKKNNNTIGSDPRVGRFMKGIFELRTPLPKYQQMWNVGILLNYFKEQKANTDLSLKD